MSIALEPAIGYPLFALLGLVFGSFGNVVIGRLPAGESLNGRSHCPKCGRILSAFELVPVLSWALLRAKCRGCRQPISSQYPLIEIVTSVLFVLAFFLAEPDVLRAFPIAIAFWTMLVIALIDMRTQLIPDVLTILLVVCGIALASLDNNLSLLAPGIGLGFFGVQWLVSRGKWVGSGDIFLAGAFGLLLGSWEKTVLMLFLAYIGGSFVVIALLLSGKVGRGAHVAFGPFLVGAAFIAFVMGERILALVVGG